MINVLLQGTLVKALKAGEWVLLDEINLASAETLQCSEWTSGKHIRVSCIDGKRVRMFKNICNETIFCDTGTILPNCVFFTQNILLFIFSDAEPIVRHEDFRLFACMNPATDVGKRELPPGVRNRFTEFFVDELEDVADLKILIAEYLKGLSLTAAQIEGIVKFYLNIRTEAVKKLTDGTGHRPHYR